MDDPVTVQVLRNKVAGLVEEMHHHFYRSGYSTIVRESRDFSCAILDAEGGLYVDAVVEQDGERESERVAAGEFAFDNDSSPWLWRSVAFGPDLELTYRSVNVFQRRSQLVQLAVRGQDTLRGPDGDVVVWQVVVTPGVEISRAWYEVDPPHRLIRWDQQPRRYLLREVSTARGE